MIVEALYDGSTIGYAGGISISPRYEAVHSMQGDGVEARPEEGSGNAQ
jgi:hypothetical protein